MDAPTMPQAHGDQVYDDGVYDLFERISLDTLSPDEEVCVLSRQGVNHPVRTHRCKHVFEEAALIEYIKTKILRPVLCPRCHVPMRTRTEEVESSKRAAMEVEFIRREVKEARGMVEGAREVKEVRELEKEREELGKKTREVAIMSLEVARTDAVERAVAPIWQVKRAIVKETFDKERIFLEREGAVEESAPTRAKIAKVKETFEKIREEREASLRLLEGKKKVIAGVGEGGRKGSGVVEGFDGALQGLKETAEVAKKVNAAIDEEFKMLKRVKETNLVMGEIAHELLSGGAGEMELAQWIRGKAERARMAMRARRFQIEERVDISSLFEASSHPEQGRCPISKKEMTVPVRICCGHVFKQDALIRWILTSDPLHRFCPECQTPMRAVVESKGGIDKRILEALGVVCTLFERVDLDALPAENRVCCLSGEQMKNPVRTRGCGHVFEEADLINYMKSQDARWSITCPVCPMSMEIVEEVEAKKARESVEKAEEIVRLREQVVRALEVELAVAVAAEIRKEPARAGEGARKEEVLRTIGFLKAAAGELEAKVAEVREVGRVRKEVERAMEVLMTRREEKREEASVYAFFAPINFDTQSDGEVCPISQEEIDSPVKLHGCNHVFEEIKCIHWLMVSGGQPGRCFCPLCRRPAKTRDEVEEVAIETERAKTGHHRGKRRHKGGSRARRGRR